MSVGMYVDILDTEDKFVELVYLYTGSQGGTQACLAVTWPSRSPSWPHLTFFKYCPLSIAGFEGMEVSDKGIFYKTCAKPPLHSFSAILQRNFYIVQSLKGPSSRQSSKILFTQINIYRPGMGSLVTMFY